MSRTIMLAITVMYIFTNLLLPGCRLVSEVAALFQPTALQPAALNPDWLVSAAELNQLSDDIGIVQWSVTEDMPGEQRICRIFQGASWSASPNTAMNCVNSVYAGSNFEQIIKSMYDIGILVDADIELQPVLAHNHDFAIYAHQAGNGQSVFDAFLLADGRLFRASVTLGTPTGSTPESLFAVQGETIEAFLTAILQVNIERSS